MNQQLTAQTFEIVATYPIHEKRVWFVEFSVPDEEQEGVFYHTELEVKEDELKELFRSHSLVKRLTLNLPHKYDFEDEELNDYLIKNLILKALN